MKALLEKYGQITPLRPDEEEAFKSLATNKRQYQQGATLIASELDAPDQLFIVDEGRLFASMEMANGMRAITRLYFAGDIVGTANIPFENATQTITVTEPAQIYLFPRSNLVDAFTRMPRIAAIFYTFAAMETAILNDRLCSIGRTTGRERLANLLLEISARLTLIDQGGEVPFSLGLTQAQIGDAIGLSEIQVNRLLRQLASDCLIERDGRQVTGLDQTRLCAIAPFKNRYEDLDLDWFKDEVALA